MQAGQFRILIRRSGKRDSGFGRLASMLRFSKPDSSIFLLKEELRRDQNAAYCFSQALKAFTFDNGSEVSFDQAIYIAGEERVRKVALASAMLTATPKLGQQVLFDLDAYRRRCVTTAALLESLTQRYKQDSADWAFYTGLLLDSGYLVMSDHISNDFQQMLFKVTSGGGTDVLAVERQHLGLDHAELGVEVAAEFGLPEQVIQGIKYHHRPMEAPEEYRYWCSLCHLASWLVDNLGLRIASGMPEQILCQEAFEEIKIDPDYEENISASVKFAAGVCDDAVRYLLSEAA